MRRALLLTLLLWCAPAWGAPDGPAAIEARLASLPAGPHADEVRAIVRAAGRIRAASLELVEGPGGVTLVAWDRRAGGTREAWLVTDGDKREISDLMNPIEVARDGKSAGLVRAPGPLSLRGDPRAGLGVVRAGASDLVIYRVLDGKLVHAAAPLGDNELRTTVCGPALVAPGVAHFYDLQTLRSPGRHPCRDALANLLRAAVDADPVVRDAEKALAALAPDRYYKAPGTPEPGPIPTGARADAAERAAVLPAIDALAAPPGGRRPAPGKLVIRPEDFGCKDPRSGAYLVRVVGIAEVRLDAVVAVTTGGVRLAAGWETAPSEIQSFVEVDLDGDGAVETAVMRVFRDEKLSGWELFRADGRRLGRLANLSRYPRLRPVHGSRGDGLLAGDELLRWNGKALAPVKSGFPEVRAAVAAVAAAKASLAAHKEELLQALWADVPALGGRAAWENDVRARCEKLGAWSDRVGQQLAAVPRSSEF